MRSKPGTICCPMLASLTNAPHKSGISSKPEEFSPVDIALFFPVMIVGCRGESPHTCSGIGKRIVPDDEPPISLYIGKRSGRDWDATVPSESDPCGVSAIFVWEIRPHPAGNPETGSSH